MSILEALGGLIFGALRNLVRDLFDPRGFLWFLLLNMWDKGLVRVSKAQPFYVKQFLS